MMPPRPPSLAKDLETQVVTLVRRCAENDRLQPGDDLHDSGITSLQSVILVTELEKAFNIELPMGDFYASRSLEDLAEQVRGRIDGGR